MSTGVAILTRRFFPGGTGAGRLHGGVEAAFLQFLRYQSPFGHGSAVLFPFKMLFSTLDSLCISSPPFLSISTSLLSPFFFSSCPRWPLVYWRRGRAHWMDHCIMNMHLLGVLGKNMGVFFSSFVLFFLFWLRKRRGVGRVSVV